MPESAIRNTQAKNQATDSRTPKNRMAPTGASSPQSVMPLAVMKLPMLHCTTKGMNRNSAGLADAEEIEVPRLDVEQQVGRQQQLEGEGQGRRELRPQHPVDDQPQHRGDADQAGGEHQQRLVEPQLVAVAGLDAGGAQPVEEAG